MLKTSAKFLSIVMALFVVSPVAAATKPCPPLPCHDLQSCAEIAVWIADGEIDDIQNHKEGFPLNKNMAEFEFEIERWLKIPETGVSTDLDEIEFVVGWCDNRQELPKVSRTDKFRFYGANNPDARPAQYLYFERLR